MTSTGLAKALARLEEPAYAALRIVAGFMVWFPGAQKILGWLAVQARHVAWSQQWVGGIIERCGGTLLALGLFSRPVAFLLSGTMAVAYIQYHWKLRFADWQWLPIVNKGELAVIFCFVFLFIATRGPGAA